MIFILDEVPQNNVNNQLENLFPGYSSKKIVEFDAIQAYVLYHEHSANEKPCFTVETLVGTEVTHSFQTDLLLVPRAGVQVTRAAYLIMHIVGYSVYSDRYDQVSVTVTCDLDTGLHFDIAHKSFYEKYVGQYRNRFSDLTPLLNHLRTLLGYLDLNEERIKAWINKMRLRFSY